MVILNIIGKLGGRKFVITILNAILLPILATKLPPDIAATVVTTIASVAGVFIFGQAVTDSVTNGKTSTAGKTFKEMSKAYKAKKK